MVLSQIDRRNLGETTASRPPTFPVCEWSTSNTSKILPLPLEVGISREVFP